MNDLERIRIASPLRADMISGGLGCRPRASSLLRPARRVRGARLEAHGVRGREDAMTQNNDGFVPVIDIAPYLAGTAEGKRRVAAQLDRACREVGFYVIVGHGVDPVLVEQVETVSRAFFDLPLDEKM